MEIPWQRLATETLRRVVEEFVTREGTEYGRGDISLEQKVEQVLRQLRRGEAGLVFDSETESCHIVSAKVLKMGSSSPSPRQSGTQDAHESPDF